MSKEFKCDFCGEEAIGYTYQQINLYCLEHMEKALEIEAKFLEEIEKYKCTE